MIIQEKLCRILKIIQFHSYENLFNQRSNISKSDVERILGIQLFPLFCLHPMNFKWTSFKKKNKNGFTITIEILKCETNLLMKFV